MTTDGYPRFRFLLFRAAVVLAFLAIALKLWDLQVVSSQEYQRDADANRFRLISTDAPRGIIYDRFGRMLVRNIPSFTVSIAPAGLPDDDGERAAVLARVAKLLGMEAGDPSAAGAPTAEAESEADAPVRGQEGPTIEDILRERTINPYAPVRIATNVDRQAAFIIEEEHLTLPGVLVEAEALRQYIDGPLTAHLLGYVGRIPSENLKSYLDDKDLLYEPDDLVGLTGVEFTQEKLLRGVKGQKHIEVDAFERQVDVIASSAPSPGHNLLLTIDLELQRVVEEALREGMRNANSSVGVAIALDPRTGEVLAMVSLPSYDNNLFSGGISYDDYAQLSSDPHHPLVNHAVSGQYPPGSTFKLVPASGLLEEKVIDRSTSFLCQGTLLLPNKYFPDDLTKAQTFYCWRKAGHGRLPVKEAIAQSCDIFFYQAVGGYREFMGLGIDRLGKYAELFGYGAPTGIELSGEAAGLVPSDRWKRQVYGENWLTGDSYNAAIGQGFVLATPLQVVNAAAAVANGGTLYRPQLIYQVMDAEGQVVQTLTPDPIGNLGISPENLELVRRGMFEAVAQGTAPLARLPGINVAGKTGTAEYPGVDENGKLMLDKDGHLPTHAWFVCFAPYEAPEIAVVVFLEGGGEGSTRSAPVAAKILRAYFGLPEPNPTPSPTASAADASLAPTLAGE